MSYHCGFFSACVLFCLRILLLKVSRRRFFPLWEFSSWCTSEVLVVTFLPCLHWVVIIIDNRKRGICLVQCWIQSNKIVSLVSRKLDFLNVFITDRLFLNVLPLFSSLWISSSHRHYFPRVDYSLGGLAAGNLICGALLASSFAGWFLLATIWLHKEWEN